MWESCLYGSERGWSATLVRMKYCGTAGKPGGKQRKQTSSYSQGSLQPTRRNRAFWHNSRLGLPKKKTAAIIFIYYANLKETFILGAIDIRHGLLEILHECNVPDHSNHRRKGFCVS